MNLLIKWLINGTAVFASAYLLSGVHLDSFTTALLVALVLGIVNSVIKPILFILTLPITIITFGLFALILNTLMILLTDTLVKGFFVDSFLWALLFSLVLSLVSSIINKLIKS